VTVANLRETFKRSADFSLLITSGNRDAAGHWFSLKNKERRELAEVPRRSWDAKSLSFPEYPASIHLPLLWRTSRERAPRLLDSQELFHDPGVPFFLVESELSGPATPMLAEPLEIEEIWGRLVKLWLDCRSCQNLELYSFSPEGVAALINYLNLVENRLTQISTDQACFLGFLPEAVRRLSLLFSVFVIDRADNIVHRESVDAAIGVIEWYGRENLRLVSKLRRPVSRREVPVMIPGLRERMLQKVQARGPILWRELRRSFANSAHALLAPIRDQLIAEGLTEWGQGSRACDLVIVHHGSSGSDMTAPAMSDATLLPKAAIDFNSLCG
jgi:hypothetical protein